MDKRLAISPFATAAELAALQAYAEREQWRLECQALGATMEQIDAYEASARTFASTTPQPNRSVIALACRLARETLARGEPMPADAEQAIDAEWERFAGAMIWEG